VRFVLVFFDTNKQILSSLYLFLLRLHKILGLGHHVLSKTSKVKETKRVDEKEKGGKYYKIFYVNCINQFLKLCVCVRERDRGRECVYVREREEREIERGRERKRDIILGSSELAKIVHD